MSAWIPQACHDSLRELYFPSIVLDIWMSLFNQLRLSHVETKNTWTTLNYITALVHIFVCHHFSPPSLRHSIHCKMELSEIVPIGEMVPIGILEGGDTGRLS